MLIPRRPGPAPACTGAELLTIALVRHPPGRRSENGFRKEIRRNWGHLFPHLPDQPGRPYRSFGGLLAHLGTLTRNQVLFAGAPAAVPVLTEPTSEQCETFGLIGAPIPLVLKK